MTVWTSEAEWDRAYGDAMQWRDWQTCEYMLAERDEQDWYTKPEENMGNGERDNALRLRGLGRTGFDDTNKPSSPIDLCVCGTKTRAEHGCLCAPEVFYDPKTGFTVNEPETVLQEADRLTAHPRGKTYGHPYVDFQKVVGMAMALWGRGPESPEEHALYMILVKLARLEATPGHHDSIVDIAGYIKTYDMVIQEKVSRLTS